MFNQDTYKELIAAFLPFGINVEQATDPNGTPGYQFISPPGEGGKQYYCLLSTDSFKRPFDMDRVKSTVQASLGRKVALAIH